MDTNILRQRFAGAPLKRIAVTFEGTRVLGEAIVTMGGLEGGAVYTLSSRIREALAVAETCTITLDLRPDMSLARLIYRLDRPRGKQSLSNYLRKAAGLSPVAISLLREGADGQTMPASPDLLAARIKALPLVVHGVGGLARAISTAGGVALLDIDERFMLTAMPGVFVAGEMLDWEAPTGGYLLQGCFSTGRAAARGILHWLGRTLPEEPTPEWALPATVTNAPDLPLSPEDAGLVDAGLMAEAAPADDGSAPAA